MKTLPHGADDAVSPTMLARTLAAEVVLVPVDVFDMLRGTPVMIVPIAMSAGELPVSIYEFVPGTRAGGRFRNRRRRDNNGCRSSKTDTEPNAWRGEHRATGKQQAR